MTIETQFPLNVAVFHLLNVGESPGRAVVTMAKVLAAWSPWAVLAALGAGWLFGGAPFRRATVMAGAALALGLAVNFTIASLIYVPRPFELDIGRTLVAHAPETSLPSDHATFLWSLGFGLLFSGEAGGPAVAVIGVGAFTAWARVYLGLHFPLDMAASLAVAVFAAGAARAAAPGLRRYVLPLAEWLRAWIWRAAGTTRNPPADG